MQDNTNKALLEDDLIHHGFQAVSTPVSKLLYTALICYTVLQNNKIINNNGWKYIFLKDEKSKESTLYHG